MGESRVELIAWVNDVLQLNYTKVEQLGSGAAFCQILDSIYGDLPMSRVKMQAKLEYEYLANFKVLQTAFKAHSIDKPIPVDRLVKCKMQDNLEFVQWMKKYWDLHYPGGEYDAVGRRKGLGGDPPAPLGRSTGPAAAAPRTTAAPVRRPVAAAPVGGVRAGSRAGGVARTGPAVSDAAMQALNAQMNEMKLNVENLEKERDFYFNKLREIEILIGARLESGDESITETEQAKLKEIEAILYSTEEGFEVPEDGVEGEAAAGDVDETF